MGEIKVAKYEISGRSKALTWAAIVVGLITFVVGYKLDKTRVWTSYLTSFFYFVSIALGGLFFTAIQHVTKAGWSVNVRRISEGFASFLPFAVLLAAIFLFGAPNLYEWLNHDHMAHDLVLQKKAGYLNMGAFLVRTMVFFAIWLFFSWKIVGNSLKQDQDGKEEHTLKNVPLSIAFILLFALSYSLFSVDFLMSLDAHWFSTMFGVYSFAGLFQSTLALMTIIAIYLYNKGVLKDFLGKYHFHDMGKFVFAFTVFYAYIAFSQFMLIWYANLPEETGWYMLRGQSGWMTVSMSLLIFKFVVPFLALASKHAKRSLSHVRNVCWLILAMQFVDNYWLIYPNFNDGKPVFSFVEVGIFIGFAGLFWLSVSKFYASYNMVPVKDPRIHESMHHHF